MDVECARDESYSLLFAYPTTLGIIVQPHTSICRRFLMTRKHKILHPHKVIAASNAGFQSSYMDRTLSRQSLLP